MTQLTGTVTGSNRAELTARATELAATYFGNTCVKVALGSAATELERGQVVVSFVAEFTAVISHDPNRPGYGPPTCRRCGKKFWPHDPPEGA